MHDDVATIENNGRVRVHVYESISPCIGQVWWRLASPRLFRNYKTLAQMLGQSVLQIKFKFFKFKKKNHQNSKEAH